MTELIDKYEVAKLLNEPHKDFVHHMIRRDPMFPLPQVAGTSRGRSLWRRSEILTWQQMDRLRPRGENGRRLLPKQPKPVDIDRNTEKRRRDTRKLALQFLAGKFDPVAVRQQTTAAIALAHQRQPATKIVVVMRDW